MDTARHAKMATAELQRRFAGRSDVWAEQQADGTYRPRWTELTLDILGSHVRGDRTVGVYQLDRESRVGWIAIDLDVKDPDLPFADALPGFRHQLQAIEQTASDHGLSILLEASGRRGFHVILIAEDRLDAALARRLGHGLVEASGPIHRLLTAEVFPKQARLNEGQRLGNLLKLPWGRHRRGGRSQFVDRDLDPIRPWFTGQLRHLQEAPLNTVRALTLAAHRLKPASEPDDPPSAASAPDPPAPNEIGAELLRLLRRDLAIRALFHGDPVIYERYATRSEAEFALALRLLHRDIPAAQVNAALHAAGIGKWAEAGEHYRRRTLEKARHQIESYRRSQSAAPNSKKGQAHA